MPSTVIHSRQHNLLFWAEISQKQQWQWARGDNSKSMGLPRVLRPYVEGRKGKQEIVVSGETLPRGEAEPLGNWR